MELEVRIERLGAQGDGMARGPDGPLLVPFTLPGELVSVAAEPGENHAKSLAILEPSGERVAPVCPHFGTCGGCALQHMEAGAYLAWKREQGGRGARLSRARSTRRGGPTRAALGRRRAAFTLERTRQGVSFGYRASRSHEIVDIAACSAAVSSPACQSSRLHWCRCLAGSAKRASPSRRPARASTWLSRVCARPRKF